MAFEDFIDYLHDLNEQIQKGEINMEEYENVSISLDGGYSINDDDGNVLLDLTADGDDDTLIAEADNGNYTHTFLMGGQDDWDDDELELWEALQAVRGSLY